MTAPDSRLLVPMFVEALCVGATSQGTWSDLSPRYSHIGRYNTGIGLGVNAGLFNSTRSSSPPEPGVHLHWAIPKAFTHGQPPRAKAVASITSGVVSQIELVTGSHGYDAKSPPTVTISGGGGSGASATAVVNTAGQVTAVTIVSGGSGYTSAPAVVVESSSHVIEYPPIPNRWLALRMFYDPGQTGHSTIALKAWVVESDFTSQTLGTTQFPVFGKGAAPQQPYQFVGRTLELSEWLSGPAGNYLDKPLTALGPGDTTFAAFYPTGRGAIGFHDPEPPVRNAGTALSYMVTGWFADSKLDPLYSSKSSSWASIMEALGWAWSTQSDAAQPNTIPTGILCHGLVQDVQWTGKTASYDSGIPEPPKTVALGNTSAEALAAYAAKKIGNPAVAETIEAFQYQLLSEFEEPGGDVKIAEQVESHGFGKASTGTRWQIARIPQGQPGYVAPDGRDSYKPFPSQIGEQLNALIDLQIESDRLANQLDSSRGELYSNWYNWNFQVAASLGTTSADVAEWTNNFTNKVATQAQNLSEKNSAIANAVEQLKQVIAANTQLPGYELTSTHGEHFRHPNDFAVLLPGCGRSAKYADDSRYLSSGELFCRVGSDLLSLLLPKDGDSVDKENLSSYFSWLDLTGFPNAQNDLPELLKQLFVEAVLLDEGFANMLADVSKTQTDTITAIQGKLWKSPFHQADAQTTAKNSGFQGTLPSVMAINPWQQPWSPILMQWQVKWIPSYAAGAEANEVLTDWSLEPPHEGGNLLPIWTAPAIKGDSAGTFAGVTLLTPGVTQNLGARIDEYLTAHGAGLTPEEKQQLQSVAKLLADADILSQSMGGLHSQLMMQHHPLMLPPCDRHGLVDESLESTIAEQNQSVPLCSAISGELPLIENLFTIRAGEFELEKIWVVDCFGQTLELAGDSMTLVLPDYLASPADASHFLAPPRIAQPTRLNADCVSASDDSVATNSDPATNPVCGWLVPNHLDGTLMIFDSDGSPIGVMKEDIEGGGYKLNPVAGQTSQQVPANQHLKNLLAALPETASDLVTLIKARQQNINPTASWDSQNIAVLIGHPLALVRASVQLELQGNPAGSQNYHCVQEDGANQPGVFPEVPVPTYLGNATLAKDGLICAFSAGVGGSTDYSEIYPAFGFAGGGKHLVYLLLDVIV